MQKTVFVAGVSGVGKTTFVRSLSGIVDFQHLTASEIIKDQKRYFGAQAVSSEELRNADIGDNQRMLIDGFHRLKSPSKKLIIIDGHTIIESPAGLVEIEVPVFMGLGVDQFIFLMEQPQEIMKRRQQDLRRTRPAIEVSKIEELQKKSREVTEKISKKLGVPTSVVFTNQLEEAAKILVPGPIL